MSTASKATEQEFPQRLPRFERPQVPDPRLYFDCLIVIVEPNAARGLWISNGVAWVATGGGGSATWGAIGGTLSSQSDLTTALNGKQATLVSGTNIKTVNGASLLGSGDVVISGSSAWGGITGTLSAQSDLNSALNGKQATLVSTTNIKTINGVTILGSGDLVVSGSGDMVLASVQTVTGAKTFGGVGAVGKLILAGNTSGTSILNAAAVAGTTTITLPGATTTLIGTGTTDTLTNKTIDGESNTLSVRIADLSDTSAFIKTVLDDADQATACASLGAASDLTGYTLGSGTTAITHATHANRVGVVNQAGATTGTFAATGTSGALIKDTFYLRNTGAGTFTASGTITAPTGFKLTALPNEVFTADYDSVDDAWFSTTPVVPSSANAVSMATAADYAAMKVLLALTIGANVQAWDADLDAFAALGASNDDIVQRKAGAWANRTIAQLLTDLQGTGSSAGSAGFRGLPQNSRSAVYTTVLADAGGHIYHPSADTTARTFTIDSNANVAYPLGTTLTFVNDSSAGVVTIAITSDTLVLAGAGTTGSRSLAANGIATAVKMTSTRWIINGTGLS